MKIVGLLVAILGWFIAVMSVKVSGVPLQLMVAVMGLVIAAFGVLRILNGAHLKDAIWKV